MKRRTAILVPNGDLIIPDPKDGAPLPKLGKRVALSTYWTRRLKEGSVFELDHETKKVLRGNQ